MLKVCPILTYKMPVEPANTQPSKTATAVIFDLDGVLIDSGSAHLESWKRLAADLGQDVTEEQFRDTFGRQNRDIIPLLFGEHLGPQRVDELGETKERYYREQIDGAVTEVPGAVNLVRACQAAGMRCAVGSSGHPENIAIALSSMGIIDLFDCIVSGKDVTRGKPDPQVFLIAAERIGVSPLRCAVVEDAPAGIDAALAGEMVAIGITTQHPRARLNHAHRVVDRLDELSPEGIGALIQRAS